MVFCKNCTFLDARKQKCKLLNSVLPKISIHGKIQFMKDKDTKKLTKQSSNLISCAGCNSQICDIHKHACRIYNILQNNNMVVGAGMFYDTLKKIYKLCTIKDSK